MNKPAFRFHECTNSTCAFRFSLPADQTFARPCPHCGAPVQPVGAPHPRHAPLHTPPAGSAPPVHGLLDNIRSLHNTGSMFRTADAAGLAHLHLCGITATPGNPRLAHTAIGAEQTVPWSAHRNGLQTARALQSQGLRLWALEGGVRAEPLFAARPAPGGGPLVLVVGNELAGIDPEILALCERVLAIPMLGAKHSLNVAVAFGIAAYHLRFGVAGPPGHSWLP